jgi:hypothetical protein
MPILIANTEHSSVTAAVVAELNTIKGPLVFEQLATTIAFRQDNFQWQDFFAACTNFRQAQQIDPATILIVLTPLNNESNWFSCFDMSGTNNIFIHSTGWSNYVYCNAQYPLAYEALMNYLHIVSYAKQGSNFFEYVHHNAIGCINDMCGYKPDIILKFRTADICKDCYELFKQHIPAAQLQQVLQGINYLRKQMLFTAVQDTVLDFEDNMPFTVAITKRKLATTIDPFRKLLMLIDHFDSLIRTCTIILLKLCAMPQEEESVFLTHTHLHPTPSLGHWVNAISVLNRKLRESNAPQYLPENFSDIIKEVLHIASQQKIIAIRNEQRGHGYINCEDRSYANTVTNCLPHIEKIEAILMKLFGQYKYYYIQHVVRLADSSFNIQVLELTGSNAVFIEKVVNTTFNQIEDIPITNQVYCVNKAHAQWYNLHPYLHYRPCDLCAHKRVLIFDGQYLLDPYVGHRFQHNDN